VQPALALLVEDIRRSHMDGWAIRDKNAQEDFRMRCMLLLWSGDYQGQGKIANMKHSGKFGCHWCFMPFHKYLCSTGNCMGDNHRRFLPTGSPKRRDRRYGVDDTDPAENKPPAARTHEETCRVGRKLHFWRGTKTAKKELQNTTGINGFCVLSLTPMFDMIKDIMLDWMHVIKNIWEEHLLKVFKGEMKPKPPKTPAYTKNKRPLVGEDLKAAKAKHAKSQDVYHDIIAVSTESLSILFIT
jgi:hypothetical protein